MINEETSFAEALSIISNSVRPRLPFVVLWNDIETNALIDRDTPVGVGGFRTMKLGRALDIILHSVSQTAQTKLILATEGQVITLGTQRGLLEKSSVRSYSVDDIVSAPFYEETDNRGSN